MPSHLLPLLAPLALTAAAILAFRGPAFRPAATLREVADRAFAVSRGDYSSHVAPRSEKDTLGIALQRMTAALREKVATDAQLLRDAQKQKALTGSV
jgi:hypothetical protein